MNKLEKGKTYPVLDYMGMTSRDMEFLGVGHSNYENYFTFRFINSADAVAFAAARWTILWDGDSVLQVANQGYANKLEELLKIEVKDYQLR